MVDEGRGRKSRVLCLVASAYPSSSARLAVPLLRKLPHQARRRLRRRALAGTLGKGRSVSWENAVWIQKKSWIGKRSFSVCSMKGIRHTLGQLPHLAKGVDANKVTLA